MIESVSQNVPQPSLGIPRRQQNQNFLRLQPSRNQSATRFCNCVGFLRRGLKAPTMNSSLVWRDGGRIQRCEVFLNPIRGRVVQDQGRGSMQNLRSATKALAER